MKRGLWIAAAAAALLTSAPAAAQTAAPADDAASAPAEAKPKAAPKKRAAKPKALVVTITNGRASTLVSLQATPAEGGDPVKLAGPLKPDAHTQAKIPRGKGCSYTFAGEFEDGGTTESEPVDLCKTRKLRLTE